ncbi:zinc finger protein 467 [Phaenicophaeus curvirostris]|uniref:zinc finger protein 467 n=1 Tax=Phaenicophaeus curvirostris TaxID=33595 RepID=UPI0037F0A737
MRMKNGRRLRFAAEPPCATALPLPSSPHLGATSYDRCPWEPLNVTSVPRPFACAQCGKGFGKKAHLTRHLRVHTGERPYPCGECGRRFRQKIHLRSHQKTHTGERPFPCGECGRRFRKKTHLVRHHRTHTGERPFACACGRRFAHKQHLLRHQRLHQTLGEDVKTSPRGETFGEVSTPSYRRLCREEPPCVQPALTPLTFLACQSADACPKSNPGGHRWLQRGPSRLAAPGKGGAGVTAAPRPFVCELCGRRFGRKSHLARHQAVHTGTRPHACAQCAKSFSSKTNLARHQAVHTGHRPFACARCGKSFSRKTHLRRHEGTHGDADVQGWTAATAAISP